MGESNESCIFFKKRSRPTVTRKKASSSSEEEEIQLKRKTKRPEFNALYQQTAKFSKRSGGLSDDDDRDDLTVVYKASNQMSSLLTREHVATATLEIDTDHTHDAQALFEKAQLLSKESSTTKNVYLGANNYAQYIEKKDTVMGNASSGFNRKGPMRAPVNLRATVRWDYQPDICKDYKETGFCSFGDSCKFLHDRSDYKHGWQIEQELAEGIYGIDGTDNRYEILHHSSEDEADDSVPWLCLICRKEYKDPIVTNCGHYFCSECALKRYKKTARCYACTADTKGFFKFAKGLLPRIAALRAKSNKKEADLAGCTSDQEDDSVRNSVITHPSVELDESSQICDLPNVSKKVKLPVSSEPKWAQPEAPEFCDSDDDSD